MQMMNMLFFAMMLPSSTAYQLGASSMAARSPHRVPHAVQLNFFEEMKKGFEAGMGSPSAADEPTAASPAVEKKEEKGFLFQLVNSIIGEPPTEEELIAKRIERGEGVVWSVDHSRAWSAIKGMPQQELTLEESKLLAEELSVPVPEEVLERLGGR